MFHSSAAGALPFPEEHRLERESLNTRLVFSQRPFCPPLLTAAASSPSPPRPRRCPSSASLTARWGPPSLLSLPPSFFSITAAAPSSASPMRPTFQTILFLSLSVSLPYPRWYRIRVSAQTGESAHVLSVWAAANGLTPRERRPDDPILQVRRKTRNHGKTVTESRTFSAYRSAARGSM